MDFAVERADAASTGVPLDVLACFGLFGGVAVGGHRDAALQRFLFVRRLRLTGRRGRRLRLLRGGGGRRNGEYGDDRTGTQQDRLLHGFAPQEIGGDDVGAWAPILLFG